MKGTSAVQPWVSKLTLMQQSVLFTAVRGPDGVQKDHVVKIVLRAFRRVVFISAMDGRVLADPYVAGGGSFAGPVPPGWTLERAMLTTIRNSDELPHHFLMHLAHAAEIIGYEHPDESLAGPWLNFYVALCTSWHVRPETREAMNARLGDDLSMWLDASQTELGALESAYGPARDISRN